MPRPFVLPDLGEGLTEAEIVKVLVREGDVIQEDAPLLEVETDKATVEIPSPMSGRVERIHVAPSQRVHVGEVLVTFADAGAAPGKQAADTLDPARTQGEHDLLAAYRALNTRQQGALLEVARGMAGQAARRKR